MSLTCHPNCRCIIDIFKSCSNIEVLDLSCRTATYEKIDGALDKLSKLLPRLKYLNLSWRSGLSMDNLNDLSELDTLILNGTSFKTLSNIPKFLKFISLRDSDVEDEDLQYLPSALMHLDLGRCKSLTIQGLGNLPKNLQSLDLSGLSHVISMDILPRNLKSLILEDGNQIKVIKFNELPPDLEKLSLAQCGNIKLKKVKNNLNNLKFLNLSSCHKITDGNLKNFSQNLIKLDLRNCRHLTDISIKCLPRKLIKLRLERCYCLTDESLKFLPETLEILYITESALTDKALKHLPIGLKEFHIGLSKNQHPLPGHGHKFSTKALKKLSKNIKVVEVLYDERF